METTLSSLFKSIGSKLKEPHQCISIKGAEIWKNRHPEEWHLYLPPLQDPLLHCPDSRCDYDIHVITDECFFDPWCLPVIFKLQEGMRVLVFIEYCHKEHVAFFTFEQFQDNSDFIQFFSRELSRDCHFFDPRWASQIRNDFPVSIQWACVKYLAIVESREKRFGKYGDFGCFKKELERLTHAGTNEIDSAFEKLEHLNAIPERPTLKPIGILLEEFEKGDLENFKEMLSNSTGDSRSIKEVAYLFFYLLNKRKFQRFERAVNGWHPDNSGEFNDALEKMAQWYLKCAPTQAEEVGRWRKRWRKYSH